MKLTKYCCYHDKQQLTDYNLSETENFKLYYGPDDILNPFLSEFSMFKYIYVNDVDSDYIWTTHYRRLQPDNLFDKNKVNDYSCQVQSMVAGCWGLRHWAGYYWTNCEFLYNDWVYYVIEKYGANNDFIKTDNRYFVKQGNFYDKCSFILTRKHFFELCDFVLGFFEYIDNKYQLNHNPEKYKEFIYLKWYDKTEGHIIHMKTDLWEYYTIKPFYIRRLLSFMGEWLCSIYIETKISNKYLIEQT